MLHQLAIDEAGHIQCWHRHLLASWGNTHKFASVRATKRQTGGDCIPIGDHLIDAELPIREGGVEDADEEFEALGTRRQSRREIVAHVVLPCYLVYNRQALLVDDFLIETAVSDFVFFC